MQISGFFRCNCGKLHAFGGMWHSTQCPECGRDLMARMRAITEHGDKPLPARVATSLSHWARKEAEPREACPVCSFEVPKGTLSEHICRKVS